MGNAAGRDKSKTDIANDGIGNGRNTVAFPLYLIGNVVDAHQVLKNRTGAAPIFPEDKVLVVYFFHSDQFSAGKWMTLSADDAKGVVEGRLHKNFFMLYDTFHNGNIKLIMQKHFFDVLCVVDCYISLYIRMHLFKALYDLSHNVGAYGHGGTDTKGTFRTDSLHTLFQSLMNGNDLFGIF